MRTRSAPSESWPARKPHGPPARSGGGWLHQARLAVSFEAQALRNFQNNLQPFDTGGRSTPRYRPTGDVRTAQGAQRAAAKRAARVSGLGKGLGFVTSLYFMKDDIARAMNGYTSR